MSLPGASLGVSHSTATLPLTEIANFLADAIERLNQHEGDDKGRLFWRSNTSLRVGLDNIQEIISSDRMTGALKQLRNSVERALPPKKGGAARVLWGGMVRAEDTHSERTALIRLDAAVKAALRSSVDDEFLERLWSDEKVESSGSYLTRAIAFHPPYPAPFSAEIARQVTANETISGNHVEGFLNGARNYLLDGIPAGDEDGRDDVEDSIDSWRSMAESPDSIMATFIEKLHDIAPSRARLHVSIKILNSYHDLACHLARKTPANPEKYDNFIKYSERAILYYKYFCQHGYNLQISIPTTEEDGFDFASHSRSLRLYDSLPVWFRLDDQISETISKNYSVQGKENKTETVREISYLPRLNGQSPENGKTSYENAVNNIASEWNGLREGNSGWRLTRLFLFWIITNPSNLVVPSLSASEHELEVFFSSQAASFSAALNPSASSESDAIDVREASLKRGISEISQRLKNRDLVNFVSGAAKELLALLRTDRSKSSRQDSFMDNEKTTIYVNVLSDLIDPKCAQSISKHPFSDKNLCREDVGRFLLRSLLVSAEYELPTAVYAYRIDYFISERSLRAKTQSDKRAISRSDKLTTCKRALTIVLPSDPGLGRIRGGESQKEYGKLTKKFKEGSSLSIYVLYNSRDLDLPPLQKKYSAEYQDKCILAALKKTLFSVAAYVVMRRLAKSLRDVNIAHNGLLQILKISPHGKNNAARTGSETVYAVFKGVEINLRQHIRVKSQGYDAGEYAQQGFRQKAALASLDSAFRVVLDVPDTLAFSKAGVVDYEIRPSDTNAAGDVVSFVTSVRTYVAQTHPENAKQFTLERSRSYTGTDRADDVVATRSNAVVKGALDHLVDRCGCETIVLIGRQHGDRRIGRAADRHRQADPEKFLESLRATYPTVRIIPLVRKRAFVLRLKSPSRMPPIAYEIIGTNDHGAVAESAVLNEKCSSLFPLYSVATLDVVGKPNEIDETRPRSGLTTYSWLQGQRSERYTDEIHRAREVLIDGGIAQNSLAYILRSIHFIETEKAPKNGLFYPVLNPLTARSTAEFGEIDISKREPGTHLGEVSISGTALFSRIDDVLETNEAKRARVNPSAENPNAE